MRVLLAGESWVLHKTYIMGVDSFTDSEYAEGSQWLRRAVERSGHEFVHLPSHAARTDFPGVVDELMMYDVVILSDLGAKTLLLHTMTVQQSRVMPNRLDLIESYVRLGGGLLMIGGWLSYCGLEGKGGYGGTAVERVLPVEIQASGDDRVEVPQGLCPTKVPSDHPLSAAVPETWPPMLFYNRVRAKEEATTLLVFGTDPALCVWSIEHGRAAAFTADAAPHGATPEFLDWDHFDSFFGAVVEWLGGGG